MFRRVSWLFAPMLAVACTTREEDLRAPPGDDAPGSAHDGSVEYDVRDAALAHDARADVDGGKSALLHDAGSDAATEVPMDPGAAPWELVPVDEVRATCKLDPELLAAADQALGAPWAVVRYGRLCHAYTAPELGPGHVFSVTKTLGALVTGMVAYETRDLERTGRKTGPVSDEDRVDHWLDAFEYNAHARVAHVLAMVAHNASLDAGALDMSYDSFGTVQTNSLSALLNTALLQDPERLGGDLEAFTQRFLFTKLGLTASTWSDGQPQKVFGWSWVTDVRDMAKVGLLMLRGGVWSGQRLLSEQWLHRMTHPAFEEANTGYGYLTWVNSEANYDFGGAEPPQQGLSGPMLPCAPVALHERYPHGLSEASDCHYGSARSCEQVFDVGVWQAVGLNGHVIQGHPGLDLVLVARDLTPLGPGPDAPILLWNALRGALIAEDPSYRGDEAAFCEAYAANAYAPDR